MKHTGVQNKTRPVAIVRFVDDGLTPEDRAQLIEDTYMEIIRQRGLEAGREERREEGREEAKLQLALKMVARGFSVEESAELVGMPSANLHNKLKP